MLLCVFIIKNYDFAVRTTTSKHGRKVVKVVKFSKINILALYHSEPVVIVF